MQLSGLGPTPSEVGITITVEQVKSVMFDGSVGTMQQVSVGDETNQAVDLDELSVEDEAHQAVGLYDQLSVGTDDEAKTRQPVGGRQRAGRGPGAGRERGVTRAGWHR